MISYYDWTNEDLKFAICDLSESTNGNCDQTSDWSGETVDSEGNVGDWTSIEVDANARPMISYAGGDADLKFAIGSPPSPPVGGMARLPDASDSSASGYLALTALAGVAAVALTAGAWYARRQRLR